MANKTEGKTYLKFDTGAKGFVWMIYVLAATAVLVLGLGLYFIFFELKF